MKEEFKEFTRNNIIGTIFKSGTSKYRITTVNKENKISFCYTKDNSEYTNYCTIKDFNRYVKDKSWKIFFRKSLNEKEI